MLIQQPERDTLQCPNRRFEAMAKSDLAALGERPACDASARRTAGI
jgi:hypothetical protein